MRGLSERTACFTDSVIRRMTRISNQYGAVNLSQGFPDFNPPQAILDRLGKVTNEDVHQYSITWGAQNLREALAEKQSAYMGIEIDPNCEIVVTCGSTEAMMAAMMTVVNPGDQVAIFSPFYENYGADTILSGAVPVYIPLTPPDYHYDPEVLEDAFRKGAKALVLCNPSNPCGKVFTREELEQIAEIVKRYDAYVITDEVYEHIVYHPHRHIYMASLEGMRERTISCSLQEAVIPGLKFGEDYYQGLLDTYTRKRDLFLKGLDEIGLIHNTPQGAYYVMMDISEFGYEDDLKFCEDLARKVGVGAVPGSSFFREPVNHLIRFHYAKKDETLQAALDRLADIRRKL